MSETGLAFLLCFGVGITLTVFVRPMYGLYTYLAAFYLDPPSRWWGAALPDVRWSLVAAMATLVAVALHRAKLDPDRPPWHSSAIVRIMIVYVAWMWLQAPWVLSPLHMTGTILFTKYILLFYLIYKVIDNERDFFGFCYAHVLGCAYLGWLIFQLPNAGRVEGVGGPGIDNANTLGMHLATGAIFAGFLLLSTRGWRRWTTIVAIPLIINGIIQGQTRGAIIGLVLGGIATLYLKPTSVRKSYYALVALGGLGALVLVNPAFLHRMSSLSAAVDSNDQWDNSAESRVAIAKAQLRMFADHPFGAGHQGTAALSQQYIAKKWLPTNSSNRASHNTILSVLVDQGIPGIVLFVALVITVFRMIMRLKALDRAALPARLGLARAMIGGALMAYITAGMFAQYVKAEVLIWMLALLAVLWEFARKAQLSSEVSDEKEERARPKLQLGRPSGQYTPRRRAARQTRRTPP